MTGKSPAPRIGYKVRLPENLNTKVLLLAHSKGVNKHTMILELVESAVSGIDFVKLLDESSRDNLSPIGERSDKWKAPIRRTGRFVGGPLDGQAITGTGRSIYRDATGRAIPARWGDQRICTGGSGWKSGETGLYVCRERAIGIYYEWTPAT